MSFEYYKGAYVKLRTLPVGKDAQLRFQKPTSILIYIDWQFEFRPDLKKQFCDNLLQRFGRILETSGWAAIGPGQLVINVNLADLGFSQNNDARPSNFLPTLPEPEENRRIGDLDVSTGSGWIKRLNLRL